MHSCDCFPFCPASDGTNTAICPHPENHFHYQKLHRNDCGLFKHVPCIDWHTRVSLAFLEVKLAHHFHLALPV